MESAHELQCGPLRINLRTEQVWRGTEALHLRPKSFAVLRYLIERAGRLVSKDMLLQACWPETVGSEAALTICIGELRRALGDAAQASQFIVTVPRRGFRFIGPITLVVPPAALPLSPPLPGSPAPLPLLVGRDAELAQLQQWLVAVQHGERQVVFVTGESGIGKTTMVDTLCAHTGTKAPLWVARGQCLVQHGAGEAYLPVLEALGQLCRGPEGAQLVTRLAQQAPTWLLQMSALLSTEELEALQRRTLGATRERMLRELAEALEAMTVEQPLVLVLEDLHWSDAATVDLLAYVARRRQPARLLLIGTYRPADAIALGNPLRAVALDLMLHKQCQELELRLFTEAEVARYLATRFGGQECPLDLVRLLHQRTDGNPLFLVKTVDYLEEQGWIAAVGGRVVVQGGLEAMAADVPKSLRQLIEQQLEQLSAAEQSLLEAASVAGVEWSAAAVAAAVEETQGWVENLGAGLVRREQFVQARGVEEWPDGTSAERYAFRHALYQQVLYDRLPVGQRIRLHRKLGEREADGYGARAVEKAAELAVHFDRGRDAARAVPYLQQAATTALGRYAYAEAIAHCTRGLELLQTMPDTPETLARAQQELELQLILGRALIATKGLAVPEVEPILTRAHELCKQVRDTQQLFHVLCGLRQFYNTRGSFQRARELGEELLTLAWARNDPPLLLAACAALGSTLYFLGEFSQARTLLAGGTRLANPEEHGILAIRYGIAPREQCLTYEASTLWCLGYPDQARQRRHEALSLARELRHPYSVAQSLYFGARHYMICWDVQAAYEQAEAAVTLATEQGFTLWAILSVFVRGWALAAQGQVETGLAQMHQGLADAQATGTGVVQPLFHALLAEVYGKMGKVNEARCELTEAMAVSKQGQHFYKAEMYRLRGNLLLQQAIPDMKEAETCFQRALDIARHQQAKSWELRAAMSLARLWRQQGKCTEAHQVLTEVYGWFTEGFDTADLQEARALLEVLT